MAAPRILVVDDEDAFRDMCVELFRDKGYDVSTATAGGEALEMIGDGNFQLVLSDLNLPGVDGITLLKEAKSKRPELEVILMTAYGGLESALEALRLGAYDYITKPFTNEVLTAIVGRCLEKQRLSEELKIAQEELIRREKLAALGSVSSWLAHRMRNPLNVILMCAQYLKTKFPEKDERREVTVAIEDKVKVLERMTRDFIGFSRTYEPKLRQEDLHELVNNVLESAASRHSIQNVTIEKRYQDPLPLAPVDKELMEEVLGYLFDNAVEAMGGPGVLNIHITRARDHVNLDIANTGPALSPDVRRRLFEPFFTTKERGTGLGLAIARRVIESHRGKIELLDNEHTTFRIVLPVNGR
jgi:signal transduction histidine kinase